MQGRYLCQKGDGEAGLKLLKKLVDATKNDFGHHAWGNGAVYMEAWGVGALEAGNAAEAEEAFQEALAHDAGSVRGALGLWALCERLGRTEEADRYLKLAQRVLGEGRPEGLRAAARRAWRSARRRSRSRSPRPTSKAAARDLTSRGVSPLG